MLSPLPPARTAEATANATGDKPAATEAAASTAADSVRCNSKLEDALFSAKDLPSALSEPIRAASAERTAETTGTEGSWDCTEKNGGPAGVDWWQTCRRCGGGALGASEDIGRYGDLPFIRFLELLLTDETLRGDGTRSGALQQQQQMDQQQGVLQQQQHQQLEQEREQVLNGDKGAPSCPHYIFRDRTFYFASGNAVGTLFMLAADGAAAAAVVAMLLLPSTLLAAELLVAGGCAKGTIASTLKRRLSAGEKVETCSRNSLPERCRLVSGRGILG